MCYLTLLDWVEYFVRFMAGKPRLQVFTACTYSLPNMRRAIARARLRTRLNCPRRAKCCIGKSEIFRISQKFQSKILQRHNLRSRIGSKMLLYLSLDVPTILLLIAF